MTEVPKALINFGVRRQLDILRYGNSVVRDVLALLNDAEQEVVKAITKRGDADTWTVRRLNALLQETSDLTFEAYIQAGKKLDKDMRDFASHEAEATEMLIASQVPASLSTVRPSYAQLAAIVSKEPITVGPDKKLLLEEIFQGLAASKEEAIRGAIRLGMVEGEGVDTLVRRLVGTRKAKYTDGIIERQRRGAAAIVRTVVNHTSNRAAQITYAENSDLVKGWVFMSTLDSRTTLICASLANTVWPVGEGPLPPRHVNCLPGDALVSSRSKITAVSKRWFDGDLVVLKTASGRVFTSTPNHPVLTPSGWVASGALNVGGHVISHGGSEWGGSVNCDDKDVPTRIEDVAEAFLNQREVFSMPVPLAAEDFHGDGVGSKVAVIGADRKLWDSVYPPFRQHFSKGVFGLGPSPVSTPRSVYKVRLAYLLAAYRVMGCLGKCLSLLGGCTGHAGKLLFTTVPSLYAMFAEKLGQVGRRTAPQSLSYATNANPGVEHFNSNAHIDGGDRTAALADVYPGLSETTHNSFPIDAMLARQISDGESGVVFEDEIVDIQQHWFSGHVYNLQTESNWYIAQGVVSHNCRSFAIPQIKTFRELGVDIDEMPASTRASKDGPVKADISFDEWLKDQPVSVQKDILGTTRQQLFTDGKMSLKEFTDDKGRVFTLDQLEQRHRELFDNVFGPDYR